MNMLLTLLLGLLTVVACAPGPLPLPDINVLPTPNINAEWSVAENLQITLAFRDAQFMAVAGYEAATIDNEIYLNYFPKTVSWTQNDPSEIVRAVFKSVFAGQLDGCGTTLENVPFNKDYDVPELGYVCKGTNRFAAAVDYDLRNPFIILCPPSMHHGVVDQKSYLPGFPVPVTCDTIGDTTSWRMNTLGTFILHEWTHIKVLTGQALASTHRALEGTQDVLNGNTVYGCVQAQANANQEDNLYVADTYTMFAQEAFWSKKCQKRFSKPAWDDGFDPKFDYAVGFESYPIPGP